MKISIPRIMARVHADLVAQADKAVDGFGLSRTRREELFDEFSHRLDEHFVFEEQGIFGFCDLEDKQVQTMVRRLRDEHEKLRQMAEEIAVDLNQDKHMDFSSFLSLFHSHQVFEDKSLYPRLNKDLSDDEKAKLWERIKNRKS